MKKKIIAGLLSCALAVTMLAGCGDSSNNTTDDKSTKTEDTKKDDKKEEKVDYALSDETGIINVKELDEGFELYGKSKWDDGTRLELELEKETQLGVWGYIHVNVERVNITEYTVSSDISTMQSATYAENQEVEEDVEFLGMKGTKLTFVDNSNETSGPVSNINYVLLPEDSEEGEMGYEVIIRIEAKDNYEGAKEALEEQIKEFEFDFDAYDFEEESESSEEE